MHISTQFFLSQAARLGTLSHYEGDTSKLELYFVIVNNEYGEQTEEELLPGGKSIRVTNENVITFIHLIANHRLNSQIRQQSSHFMRGFQQLIEKDWIGMFNEHELQIWAGVVSAGPSSYSFNSSYRCRDSVEYKLELGNAIAIPVFDPTYLIFWTRVL
ncbi:hypothetical protein HYC85_015105 [Camellia sinensis]|uniref:HECT-type E3 ubiquitin transferase n=1 Tax=Camellia sinensis TaxID=4442 RepID=A0A7J7HBE4_CAMSI|nr:hypothetical protein HYC85_015105 [Camellia sinensis]